MLSQRFPTAHLALAAIAAWSLGGHVDVESVAHAAAVSPATPADARFASVAVAGPDDSTSSPYRYAAQPGVVTVAVPIGRSKLVRGRSTVMVAAPIDRVRAQILAFSRYPEFMPHYSACRVIGPSPSGGRDVYMQVEALHGAVQMWARLDVKKPVQLDGREVIETAFLDGNVKELSARWAMKRIDDARTELMLEVFLEPRLPLPVTLLNRENLDGSANGVFAMKTRSERTK
jgi:ribosome-associated toxin RatA of RatAB toxin-antitoxin module